MKGDDAVDLRALYAGLAMAALLTNQQTHGEHSTRQLVERAVQYADALLEELRNSNVTRS